MSPQDWINVVCGALIGGILLVWIVLGSDDDLTP